MKFVQSLACVGVLFQALALAAPPAVAQTRDCIRNLAGETLCPPPRTVCMTERDNPSIKCSPPDGGILGDRYGKAACGAGSCVANRYGDVVCSKSPAGAAAIALNGDAVCTGGCEAASAASCTTLSK